VKHRERQGRSIAVSARGPEARNPALNRQGRHDESQPGEPGPAAASGEPDA